MTGSREGESAEPGLLSREIVHEGRIVRLSLDRVRFPGGSEGTLEFIRHAGAAAIIPFLDPPTAVDPRILLINQYRYAAAGFIFEIPAGMPEEEDAEWVGVAGRELEEETGYRAGELRYLTSIHTTPGFTDEVIHIFAACDLQEGALSRDPDEFMELRTVRFSHAIQMVREGTITDAKTISALLYARAFLPGAWITPRTAPRRTPPPQTAPSQTPPPRTAP